MGRKAGQVVINISAGTAKYIADVEKAKAKIRELGGHTVSSMQASSAAIRTLEGNFQNNIRAAERFIGLFPAASGILEAAFPVVGLVAFVGVMTEAGTKVNDFIKDIRNVPEKLGGIFRELNAPLQITNDQLRVTNDRLENDIAKLEGKRQNNLKSALDEAKESADKLADSLDKSLSSLEKVLKEQTRGTVNAFFHGEAGTEDIYKELFGETGFGGFRGRLMDESDPRKKLEMIETESNKLFGQLINENIALQTGQNTLSHERRMELLRGGMQQLAGMREGGDLTLNQTSLNQHKEKLEIAKANAEKEVQIVKAGYDEALADLEAHGTLMISERIAYLENALAVMRTYGQRSREIQHTLENEIGRLSQEGYKEVQAARDKDEKAEERYQQELARTKVEWAKRNYDAIAHLSATTEALITSEGPSTIVDKLLKINPLPNAGGVGWGSGKVIRPGGLEAIGTATTLSAAGYPTVQQQDYAIAAQEKLLALMQELNSPLGQQLDLRTKILRLQIAEGEQQGKNVRAQIIELGQIERQQKQLQQRAEGLTTFFARMQTDAKSTTQILEDGITSAVDRLSASISQIATGGKGNFGAAFKDIGRQLVQETVKSSIQKALGALGQKLGRNDGQDPTTAWWVRMVGSPATGNLPQIPGISGGVMQKLGSIFGGSAGGGIFNYANAGGPAGTFAGDYSGNTIPFGGYRASGGMVSPGSAYLVGEMGPEVLLGATGRIASNTESRRMISSGGGDHYYTIDARGTDPALVEQRVQRAIIAAHSSAVSTAVQATIERQKRTPQR